MRIACNDHDMQWNNVLRDSPAHVARRAPPPTSANSVFGTALCHKHLDPAAIEISLHIYFHYAIGEQIVSPVRGRIWFV